MNAHRIYLGDSVYADIDEHGRGVRLTTNNGFSDDPRNEIFLEPMVVKAFLCWLERVKNDVF
jgi:hypothetical protein